MNYLLTLSLFTLVSCGGELINQDKNDEKNPKKVELVRQNQRTQRFNCDNQVTSDKVETINSVSKKFEVKPKDKEHLWSFSASNGSEVKGRLANNTGIFTLDIAPTVFNIRVYPGLNEIDYSFSYCDDKKIRETRHSDGTISKKEYCVHSPIKREEDSLFFDIIYKVEELPGVRVIRMDGQNCD